jgi:hypothetical protein
MFQPAIHWNVSPSGVPTQQKRFQVTRYAVLGDNAAANDAAANAGNDATANDTAPNNAAASDAAARGAATATIMIQQQRQTCTQVVLDYVPMIR